MKNGNYPKNNWNKKEEKSAYTPEKSGVTNPSISPDKNNGFNKNGWDKKGAQQQNNNQDSSKNSYRNESSTGNYIREDKESDTYNKKR